MQENILRHPGPTPLPRTVELAMAQAMMSHRSAEFVTLYRDATTRVRTVFGTTNDILLLPSGGTAALEAAAVNITSPGDDVVVVTVGAFGDYFVGICEQHGLHVHKLEKPWGEACSAEDLRTFLNSYTNIKAVFLTYNETSTGVVQRIDELSAVVHELTNALIVVDGVSALGGVASKMDDWGVDILVTGSQKAMMLPPGLAFVSVSERAWQVIENNNSSAYYLNLLSYRNWAEKGMTPNTPAVSLIYGLQAVCNLLDEETFDKTVQRHELMKNMTRAAMTALGLELLANDSDASPTITAVKAPNGINLGEWLTALKRDYKLDLAGGLGDLQGKMFRFGHMGYCFPSDILQAVSLIEAGLQDFGYKFTAGAGVLAAQKVFLAQ